VRDERCSGVSVPLFSLTSSTSWGVGEFRDLPAFARWLSTAGQSLVQILPITEIPDAETSPYSALTAMALDPIYIALPLVADFAALGGEASLSGDDKAALDDVRAAARVDHRRVRALKARWLRRSYQRFADVDGTGDGDRARRFERFQREEAAWLDDYALFQAIRGRFDLRAWWEWPEPLRSRHEKALVDARHDLADEIRYRKYVQWIADEQWADARRQSHPVRVFGDLPFMISADSPDVWTQQNEFRFDATVGVPPDAFSETGQDWGLPPWRWDVMAQDGYEWMDRRARRSARLFDGFRLDHLVGLYRTYIRPRDPQTKAFFAPPDEASQRELGDRLVRIYQASGAEIIAEDLGTVPDFVRASLVALGVPGFKVLRWERHWNSPGQPFIDPTEYPVVSVATTGTHDTEPTIAWWDALPGDERKEVLQIPAVRRYLDADGDTAADRERVVDALLRALFDAPSRLVLVPLQDFFALPDRINTPALVDETNWTWRLPWRVDALADHAIAGPRARVLREWVAAAGRVREDR
jgi:4-alpha-glucanotransferase